MEVTEIKKISEDTRYKLKRGSAWSLPNNPSERGMKADDIRKAFYKSFLEGADSLIGEQNRMTEEVNQNLQAITRAITAMDALCGVGADGEGREALQTAAQTLIGAINELDALLRYRTEDGVVEDLDFLIQGQLGKGTETIIGRINVILRWINHALPGVLEQYVKNENFVDHVNGFTDHVTASAIKGITENDPHHTRQAISIAKNEIIASYLSPINAKILEHTTKIDDHGSDITANMQRIDSNAVRIKKNEDSILAVESQLSGVSRSFALPDFTSFLRFMNGESSITAGDLSLFVWELATGDNVLLIEHNTADFWYQHTSDVSAAETYTYNGVEYELIAKDADGNPVGLLHVAETDYNVIEGQVVSAKQSADEAKAAAAETDADRVAIETLVNSIFYIQKAPTLEHINDAVMLPTPTLAMLPDGMI